MGPSARSGIGGATPFSVDEYAERFERLRGALDERRLDALLVTAQANFDYFTGFVVAHPWVSLSRNVAAILTRDGRATVIVPAFLEGEARAGSWIDDIRLHEAIGAAPVQAIADAARALGLDGARIGAELGREQRLNLSQVDVEKLQRALAPAVLADAAEAIWDVRMRKSAAEIECLRRGCAITARVFERIFCELDAGVSEREIAHRVRQLMLEEGADRPGWVMMTSGAGEYHRTFGTPRDRVVERGDMVFMDLSVIVHGYGADFGRAGVIGGPTTAQRAAQAATIAATDAAIAVIGPGVSVAAVAAAAIESLDRSGFPLKAPGRIGHGLGLLSTEPPDISTSDDTVLQPGMVITIEPTIIRDDGMFQSEHDIAVTDTGCDVLSASSPAHLRDLPATRAG